MGDDSYNDNDEEKGIDDKGGDLFSSSISSKYHDVAMDGLTFSFADSNIGSIVLDKAGMTISKGHVKGGSEFAAQSIQKRISLSQANNQTIMNSLGIIPSIRPQQRERSGTGLDAFSVKSRQKRTMSIAAAMSKKNTNNK